METGVKDLDRLVLGSGLYQRAMGNPPYWASERILAWDDAKFHEMGLFKTRHYWRDSTTLNVFSVVGSSHPEYQGMTWLEFLGNGKRMWDNLPRYDNTPEYYDGTETKTPKMSYRSVDGINWYVNADGNHRTAIARFAFYWQGRSDLHGLELDDYRFDHDLYNVYRRLGDVVNERRLVDEAVSPINTCTGRKDTAGWRVDEYEVVLVCNARRGGKGMGCREAEDYLSRLQAPFYRRWFRAWGSKTGGPDAVRV